jgi:hypothetical protein
VLFRAVKPAWEGGIPMAETIVPRKAVRFGEFEADLGLALA